MATLQLQTLAWASDLTFPDGAQMNFGQPGSMRALGTERMKWRWQPGLDAGASLVIRPKPIAKRLDQVVSDNGKHRTA